MMIRVDFRHEENRATVRCHLCGSVSGLVRDGDRFRCRETCPPPPEPTEVTVGLFHRSITQLGGAR